MPPCQPVDAIGAGDAFGGTFLTRLGKGDMPLGAARYAAFAAAMSTEGYGVVAPIPFDHDIFDHEMMARMKAVVPS